MILDSSAIVAVVLQEPGYERLLGLMGRAPRLAVGAPTLVELSIVLSARLERDARGLVSRFLLEGDVAIVPLTDAHCGTAVDAWLRYGRGRHAAQLNFGDCLSYAVARVSNEALLFTGDDFRKTDIAVAG